MARCTVLSAAALLASLLWSMDAPAQAGELRFEPERPLAGSRVVAVYRPSADLADQPALHLRARLRTADDQSYNTGLGSMTLAVLERGQDGAYRGEFHLPEPVVYAAFAVEDPPAGWTDSRAGRFWELLVHDAAGRPSPDALEQRFNDHMGRDELEVLESARARVRHHPDALRSWNQLRAAEGWVLTGDEAEARRAAHRERAAAFDARLWDADDLSTDDVAMMWWYARATGAEEIAERWHPRMTADHPTHFFVVHDRAMAIQREHRDRPADLVVELDALWNEATDRLARQRIVAPGFQAARAAEDRAAILRWAERYERLDPAAISWVRTTLAATEPVREDGLRRLSDLIDDTESAKDTDRALGQTAREHREDSTRRAGALRVALGRALLAAGRVDEAVAELERAAAAAWGRDRFRALGEAHLAAADTAGALDAFAAAATDPATREAEADSLRRAVAASHADWAAAVRRAGAGMLERTLAASRREPIGDPSGVAADGTPAAFEELAGGDATVVVFWSRYCGPSARAMPRIAALAGELAGIGVPLLAVTRDPPEAAEQYLREGGWDIRVIHDAAGEFARAFNSWGTPQYYVADGARRLRFVSSLDAVSRHVAALRFEAQDPESTR